MWLLGWMRWSSSRKAHVYLPADRLPVAACRAELRRLRALVAIGARDAERGDARVAEGEDNACNYSDGLRVTVRFANKVGDVLTMESAKDADKQPLRFYV
jgi:hypothetical protein